MRKPSAYRCGPWNKKISHIIKWTNLSKSSSIKKKIKKLKRHQRRLSRCAKDSKNRIKVKNSIAKLHYKVACSRNDTIHKLTTTLTKNYRHIVIEDLDISTMVNKKRLARPILDSGFYEFRRQISYKAELRNNKIYIADRWFASSKKCSSCGHQKETLCLSEREYRCDQCSLKIDRDLNAAICLVELLNTVSSTKLTPVDKTAL